ncbi:DUF2914 domain-containing protein [Maribacter confluentis]|uniref:DUF2914 domain-containing protein n=1 Tax=Maribacter confluentis TaxID=1656093 RepID=A0ABT8RK63_9FLAO|nr:DUF2914 domain-containing protein [Maribacter confluentis]MDO1511391.1 DUF2914 domain-containing protein [Maribacter confluentis]
MKRTFVKFRNSAFRSFIRRHSKYAPILFFIGGFIFDTLTLGRIDRTYDLTVLCLHMTSLSITLYLYNLADDGKWKHTFLERYTEYLPLAIQFFFGGLSSAYVIYFSRSVSLSKTASFFIILVLLLIANEFLKKRISNKYLQFGVYYFISFTFFAFMVPVFLKELNNMVFLISGGISLLCTLVLLTFIYSKSPSTRKEIQLGKMIGIILVIYAVINLFYFMKLIPPVPLALDKGIVAHNIELKNNEYHVTYEAEDSYVFWRKHNLEFSYTPDQNVYIFSSIFAPTNLKKAVFHRWRWYNPKTEEWENLDDIGYDITGGRDGGFRGYTFKNNIRPGEWEVQVLTEEEQVLGVIGFTIIEKNTNYGKKLKTERF